MSARTDASWNELNCNSWRRQDLEEQMMASKADNYWVKRNFGDKIKMTAKIIFAKTAEEFLAEIDRQNKLIAQGLQ